VKPPGGRSSDIKRDAFDLASLIWYNRGSWSREAWKCPWRNGMYIIASRSAFRCQLRQLMHSANPFSKGAAIYLNNTLRGKCQHHNTKARSGAMNLRPSTTNASSTLCLLTSL
jgi:hypothetical protein